MYIRMRTRRVIVYLLIALVIVAAAFFAYTNRDKTASADDTTKETGKKETKTEKFAPYTQYDAASGACKYYYTEKDSCYVPLSFCTPDAEVKKTQTLDQNRYCSETPDLPTKALRTEGGVCPFTATEGDLINLKSIATDPDEQDPTHPFGPAGTLLYKFSAPFSDSNGIWQTEDGDASITYFNVSVSDGEYTSFKTYCIEVVPGNRPPYISGVTDMTVLAGDVVKLNPKCVDPDGDDVILSYQGNIENREWMTSDEKKTADKDVGVHGVTVMCSDTYGLKAFKSLEVTVIAKIPEKAGSMSFVPGTTKDVVINEGESVTLNPQAIGGKEGASITYTYTGWMNTNKQTASYEDAGEHYVTITATDGTSVISTTVTITVMNVNRPPEIVSTNEA